MNFSRLTRASSKRREDSFVASDSDEENDNSLKRINNATDMRIIEDTDTENESSSYNSNSVSNKDESNNQSIDSEDEDRNFLNNSHRVSIIENSSDSESDENDKNKVNILKRRSIYDNPIDSQSPKSESTPIYSRFRKRPKKAINYIDSDSEDSSVTAGKNPAEKSVKETNNIIISDDSEAENDSFKQKQTIENTNIIDLTVNNSRNNDLDVISRNESIQEKSNSDKDVIVCSSTSESEYEINKEVITLAKKEIGVGNIDPIEAQKKEYLLLSIDFTQKDLDKLTKFASSAYIDNLPDKGAKVYETIKQHKEKLSMLKEKLAKLSNKMNASTRESLRTSKVKVERKSNTKNKSDESLISSSDENKENIDTNESFDNNSEFSNHFSEFDVKDIPNVPQTSFDPGELGKKALATLNKQQSLTHQRLEQLHGSLTSRPTEDAKERDPSGLKVSLMPHQQHALAWMKWREKQKPKGGILADDMGLGKTLTMISLILATSNDEKDSDSDDDSDDNEWLSRNKHKRYYGGTLVICPASLIKQWEAEVKNRCKRGLLSVLVFHGNNRNIEDRKLSKFNIVVTTYQIIVREANTETGMYRMEWKRIILDEAHYIRNHKSKACMAVCGLNAKCRWALTGTPIQNKEMDLYAILKFLQCSPFNDLQVWKRWVDNKSEAGKQRLVTIMKTLMLRRTKQELQSKDSLLSLPDKNLELIEIEMDRDENLAYQKILLFSQNLFAQFLAQRAEKQHMREMYAGKFDRPSFISHGSKTHFTKAQKVLLEHHSSIEAHEILVLLLRLRQMCCHPALLHSMLDKHDAEMNGFEEEEAGNAELLNKLHNMSINENEDVEEHVANYKIDERVAANLLTKKNPVFDNDRRSSKVRMIIKTIEEILEKGDKLIVVSQWTSFLQIVAKNLDDIEDAKYEMFTGAIAVKNRQAIVDKFNDPDEDTNILLLSLTAGGVGLNLVGANHLLLIDIHWNPQLEAQAQDRIYRFGQKKSVYVYKFICKDTIEERVKNLQDKKLEIANHVLTGTRAVSSKLTIEDLKLLFS